MHVHNNSFIATFMFNKTVVIVIVIVIVVNKSSYEKEQLKLHQSLLGVKGGGQKQPSEQPSLQHLAVTLKINICRPNFSEKCDKLNKYLRKCT